jgi:hypothetical protein
VGFVAEQHNYMEASAIVDCVTVASQCRVDPKSVI